MSDVDDVARRVEEATLESLADMSVDDLYTHIDVISDQRPGPLELYRRWEAQHWSASTLDFSTDRQQWDSFDPITKTSLEEFFAGFFVGEQMVTDTLSPLVLAAPDEESRIFLATQLVDEARHSFFFSRFYIEVLGEPSLAAGLRRAREWTRTGSYEQIFDIDLVETTDAVRLDPSNYSLWVRGITLYHLLIEGVLALVGQKQLLQFLGQVDLLPAFRTGFTAVTRDESRHVGYGVWAIRNAVAAGYGEDVKAAVDRSFESCMLVYANPDYKIIVPPNMTIEMVGRLIEQRWKFGLDSLSKRLRIAGLGAEYLESLAQRAGAVLVEAMDKYESNWSASHPIRTLGGQTEMVVN